MTENTKPLRILTILIWASMKALHTFTFKAMPTPKRRLIQKTTKRRRPKTTTSFQSGNSRSPRRRKSPLRHLQSNSQQLPANRIRSLLRKLGACSRCCRTWTIEVCYLKRCSLTWITTVKIMWNKQASLSFLAQYKRRAAPIRLIKFPLLSLPALSFYRGSTMKESSQTCRSAPWRKKALIFRARDLHQCILQPLARPGSWTSKGSSA